MDFFGLRIDVTGRCDPHVDFLFAGHEADERSGVSFEAAELGHAFLEEFQAPHPAEAALDGPVERGELVGERSELVHRVFHEIGEHVLCDPAPGQQHGDGVAEHGGDVVRAVIALEAVSRRVKRVGMVGDAFEEGGIHRHAVVEELLHHHVAREHGVDVTGHGFRSDRRIQVARRVLRHERELAEQGQVVFHKDLYGDVHRLGHTLLRRIDAGSGIVVEQRRAMFDHGRVVGEGGAEVLGQSGEGHGLAYALRLPGCPHHEAAHGILPFGGRRKRGHVCGEAHGQPLHVVPPERGKSLFERGDHVLAVGKLRQQAEHIVFQR